MTVTGSSRAPPVVGLGVGPRLLTDLLTRIFADRGLDVTSLTAESEGGERPRGSSVDVALVHGSMPAGVTADVVVHLPEDSLAPGSVTEVAVHHPQGRLSVQLSDLGELIDLIVDLARQT